MKKLKLLVTSAIVLAIVGSAFAFNAKKAVFCVVTDDATHPSHCTTYTEITKKIISTGGTQFRYYPGWDGDGAKCTAVDNALCTATLRLTND